MKKKKKLLTIVALLITTIFVASAFGIAFANTEPELNGITIEDYYQYNTDFTLPTGTIKSGLQSKVAETLLILPDGVTTKEKRVTLIQEGTYTLVFEADFSGTVIKIDKEFRVSKNLFTTKKTSSIISYDTYNAAEHDGKLGNTGSVQGAYVKLSPGDNLYYNKVIDLKGATKDDVIMNIVIAPEQIGRYDFNFMEVTLTDAYDEDNYVKVTAYYNEQWTTSAVYLLGCASCGQRLSGWEHTSGSIHRSNYGFPIRLRFDGNIVGHSQIPTIKDNSLAFSMDYENRELHHKDRRNQNISTLITDLDSSNDHSALWDGFTTGEVFVSIKCDGYQGSYASFVITDVMGEEVTTVGEFDRESPKAIVDFLTYEENNLPVGVRNNQYPLFAVEGVSVYSKKLDIKEKVYFDYTGEKQEINIRKRTFTPTVSGKYTIEITITDIFDNETIKTYDVNVKDSKTNINIQIDGENETTGIAGNLINLPNVLSTGGSGEKVIDYKVFDGSNEVEITGRAFRPTHAGSYTVSVIATDYLGDKNNLDYTVQIEKGNKAVFIDEITLPKFFISGNTYELPDLRAYNFTDGSGNTVPVSLSYVDKEASKNARGRKIIPVANKNGDITKVYYTATLNGEKTIKEFSIPTIILRNKDNSINIENLFYTSGGSLVSADSENLTLHAGQENAQFYYVNPIIAHQIDVRFSGVSTATNYDALKITLTDSENTNESIELTYTAIGRSSKFYLNGDLKHQYDVKKSLSIDNNIFSFTIDDLKHTIKFDRTSSIDIQIDNYINGNEYQGFSSGYVYMSFEFEGFRSLSSIKIKSINGKVLYDDTDDFIKPKLTILGSYGGDLSINTSYTIPKALSCDVIDGKRDIKLTMTDTNGNYVTSLDGTLLNGVLHKEYQVVLSEYGTYIVSLSAKDLSDNPDSILSYKINIVDETKPIVSINGKMPTSSKVGEKIIVPLIEATDNLDAEMDVYLYLISPTGYMFKMTTRAFIPDREGTYTVRYYVKDKAGNLAIESFDILVTKEGE